MPNAVYHLTDWSHTNAFIDPQSQAHIILFNELAAETESYVSRGSFIRRLIDKLLAPELSSDDLVEFEDINDFIEFHLELTVMLTFLHGGATPVAAAVAETGAPPAQ